MALTGDLEHLPIVDVIQLMNSSRKSGILNIKGRKGESQLVFKSGYIVGANHLNNSVRIGDILVESEIMTRATLDQALSKQTGAGTERKPLISTLLEMGLVKEKEAYAGLQSLIELTIIEILTWKKGTFHLDMLPDRPGETNLYSPDYLAGQISVDAQGVLMDALRIFDEKMRDGELDIEEDVDEEATGITADILGLDALDDLEKTIPPVFSTVDNQGPESAAAPASEPKPDKKAEPQESANPLHSLNNLIISLYELKRPPEVALAQLTFLGKVMPRALTLVVAKDALVAEKGIGIDQPKSAGASAPLGIRITLNDSPLLKRVVEEGERYIGPCQDSVLNQLFSGIQAVPPENILLLPVRAFDKTIFLTLADCGDSPETGIPEDLLDILSSQTGQTLETILQTPPK